jgi:hypothetical protein
MKRLQAIIGVAVMLLLAGCAASPQPAPPGTVIGKYVMVGGASADSGPRPTPGTVQFTASRHQPVRVRVSRSGTFSVRLPAGTYDVSGTSSRVLEMSNGSSHPTPCSLPLSVTVTARHTIRVTLTCAVP